MKCGCYENHTRDLSPAGSDLIYLGSENLQFWQVRQNLSGPAFAKAVCFRPRWMTQERLGSREESSAWQWPVSRWAITLVADLSSFVCVLRASRGRTFTRDGLRGHPCGRSRSLTARAVCNSVCWSYKEWTPVKEDHIYFRWVQPTRTLTLLQFLVCFQKSY